MALPIKMSEINREKIALVLFGEKILPETQRATAPNAKRTSATSKVNPLPGTNVGLPLVSGMTATDVNFPPNAQ